MTILEIVLEKMNAVGADGLVNCDNSCACGKDDINWCESDNLFSCELATAVLKKDHCKPEDCEYCQFDCDGYLEACINDSVVYVPMKKGETHAT